MEKEFKRGWILGGIILLVILTGCMIGGSYYMLNFSLTPNARIRAKDADSYRYLYANYPFLRPWVDSLNQVNALKDFYFEPGRHTTACLLYCSSKTYLKNSSHCTRLY